MKYFTAINYVQFIQYNIQAVACVFLKAVNMNWTTFELKNYTKLTISDQPALAHYEIAAIDVKKGFGNVG